MPTYIDYNYVLRSLRHYDRNAFVSFLRSLFPEDLEAIAEAIKEYMVGTEKWGRTIFWQIDRRLLVRTGKIINYDSKSGKRRKDTNPDWIHSRMKKAGLLESNFELQQCFFGEHLITKYPRRPVAIVEAEKTAIIASICKGAFPIDFVWLASGGRSALNVEKLIRLGRHRTFILFPDAGCLDNWTTVATAAQRLDVSIRVSSLIERLATADELKEGVDLADFLVREQQNINLFNKRLGLAVHPD